MNILFVCTGNTCRSPMAEGYLKSKNIKGVNVISRGICAMGEVSQNSVAACRDIGIDISAHTPTQIALDDINWADRVICMSHSHKDALMPYCSEKDLQVLGEGITDPFGMDIEVYRRCLSEIISSIDKMLENTLQGEFKIVPIERQHIKEIAGLEKICFSTPWSQEAILESFIAGTKFFVAVKGQEVLGYAGVSQILDEGYITNIAVYPQYRNKGIATALINEIFKIENLSFVSLEVRESNLKAISLYEKMGFKKEGLRKGFYECPKENAIIMTKRFEKNEDISY